MATDLGSGIKFPTLLTSKWSLQHSDPYTKFCQAKKNLLPGKMYEIPNMRLMCTGKKKNMLDKQQHFHQVQFTIAALSLGFFFTDVFILD